MEIKRLILAPIESYGVASFENTVLSFDLKNVIAEQGKVQKKKDNELKQLSCEETLKESGTFTLEQRTRKICIEVYKIMWDGERTIYNFFPPLPQH